MKHMSKAVSVFLALALLLALLPAAASAESTVIEINSAADLKKIGQNEGYPLSGSYRLTANIDLGGSSNPWTPIGWFTGVFDCKGHTISGLYVYVNGNDTYTGLFGYIDTGGIVQNLQLLGNLFIFLLPGRQFSAVPLVIGRSGNVQHGASLIHRIAGFLDHLV